MSSTNKATNDCQPFIENIRDIPIPYTFSELRTSKRLYRWPLKTYVSIDDAVLVSFVAFHTSPLSRLVMLQGLSAKLSKDCKIIVALTVARFSTYV
jgi:hypothetical protein